MLLILTIMGNCSLPYVTSPCTFETFTPVSVIHSETASTLDANSIVCVKTLSNLYNRPYKSVK